MTDPRPFRHHYELFIELHRRLLPRTYLEIGVRRGKSLCLAPAGTVAIGVDPAMTIHHPLTANTHLFAGTSDDFFATTDVPGLTGGLPLDLAFIDGLHLFEQALRDFSNVERRSHPGGVILLDDTLPPDEAAAARVSTTRLWSGDVWKVVACLLRHRPDLHVVNVDIPDAGLTIVTGLDPTSTAIPASFDSLCREFEDLDYGAYLDLRQRTFPMIPNDWAAIAEVLPAPYRELLPGETTEIPPARLRRPSLLLGKSREIRYSLRARRPKPATTRSA